MTALTAPPVAVAGGYSYTYNVELSGGELDATTGNTPKMPQFGTVYDFGPGTVVSSTGILATNFAFSFNDSDTAAFLTSPPDSAAVANIRFTYSGDMVVTAQDLGNFTVVSPFGTVNGSGYYDGQSYKASNDSLQGNVGFLSIPDTTAVTPEPSSLMLLGTGILGIAGVVRRRMI